MCDKIIVGENDCVYGNDYVALANEYGVMSDYYRVASKYYMVNIEDLVSVYTDRIWILRAL